MRRFLTSLALGAAVAAVALPTRFTFGQAATQPAAATSQANVPVKAVVLFSSGVGYFEHFGTVNGNGVTELRFKTNQINDILKSLVLQDMDGGKVSTITYPSQDPVSKTLRSFQVDITGNPPLGDLLNQLRGAKLTVTRPEGTKVSGTVLGVEKKFKPQANDKPPVEISVLNLISGANIKSINIDEVTDIQLDDPALQNELGKALEALTQSRDQDKKPVAINFAGQGERHIRIGYVVETPIWKTSYRLILPGGAQDKPKLQGWAIIENQTDNDWNGVQLSLVSGRPISFVQDLYQPLYIPRPVVRPELYASLRPQTYDGGIAEGKAAEIFDLQQQQGAGRRGGGAGGGGAVGGFGGGGGGAAGGGRGGRGGAAPAAAAPMVSTLGEADTLMRNGPMEKSIDPVASVSSAASASQMGELFQYTVAQPVTLPRQKSAMLPIINDDVEAEKLSIYNASVLAKNPLNGVRLKNTTGKHLLQGPITVLEQSGYAGDAQINNVPPTQERLLSYGIDLQMTIDSTKNKQDSAIQTGKIVQGVLWITRKHQISQDYIADNKSDREKTLIIEHPIRQGWKLAEMPQKPIETTDKLYRFKGTVTPAKTSTLTIKEEIIQNETIALLPADPGQIEVYSRTGEIPKNVRDALVKGMQYRQTLAETQRQIGEVDQQVNSITQEQGRIRENIKVATESNPRGDYIKRLETKLNDQETELEKLRTKRDQLSAKRDDQQKQLEDYLNNLTIG